jgi:hypothetical protein
LKVVDRLQWAAFGLAFAPAISLSVIENIR